KLKKISAKDLKRAFGYVTPVFEVELGAVHGLEISKGNSATLRIRQKHQRSGRVRDLLQYPERKNRYQPAKEAYQQPFKPIPKTFRCHSEESSYESYRSFSSYKIGRSKPLFRFSVHLAERMFVQEIRFDAADLPAVVDLDPDIIVQGADRCSLVEKNIFGLV